MIFLPVYADIPHFRLRKDDLLAACGTLKLTLKLSGVVENVSWKKFWWIYDKLLLVSGRLSDFYR
jgi:hypothetical protein